MAAALSWTAKIGRPLRGRLIFPTMLTLREPHLTLWLNWLGIWAAIVGMIFSPVLLSIGLLTMGATALLTPSPDWPTAWRRMRASTLFWGLTLLYLHLLLSGVQTYDWPYYLERLRIKSPLLLLPIAWFATVENNRGDKKVPGRIFAIVLAAFLTIALAGVLGNYAVNFGEINDLIEQGKPMPVPRGNHIRFSLLLALGSLTAIDGFFRYRSRLLLSLGMFLFIGLHFLAVRSGLAVAYAGISIVFVHRMLATRRFLPLVIGLVALSLLPVVAYHAVPSFRTKLQYMRYELLHRDPSLGKETYSDSGRLTSIRLALILWEGHPIAGVGAGNLRSEMDRLYAELVPEGQSKRPHSQYFSALAGGGAVGLTTLLLCFAAIAYAGGSWRDPRYLATVAVFFLSCLVENTLESSVGVSMFTLFLLLYGYPPYRKPG